MKPWHRAIDIYGHTLFRTVFLSIALLTLMGCAIGSLSIHPSEELNIANPSKVGSEEIRKVSKIIVPYLFVPGNSPDSKNDWRLYRAQIEVLVEELRKESRLDVNTISVQRQMDLNVFKPLSLMTEDEQNEHMQKLISAGAGNAVLILEMTAKKLKSSGVAGEFVRYTFTGGINLPFVLSLKLYAQGKREPIYLQEENVILAGGGMGAANTPDSELKEVVRPSIKPLVANLTTSLLQ
jgi:hypothetical protein